MELPLYRCNRDSQSFAKAAPNLRASAKTTQCQRIESILNDIVTLYVRCLKVPEPRHNKQPNRLVEQARFESGARAHHQRGG
jgi:hypothetical protein